jgi:agmatinase
MEYPEWKDFKDFLLRGRNVPMIEEDTPTFMGQPYAMSEEDLKGTDVAIIGAPYVAAWQKYSGVEKKEWLEAPKRVRQQSIKYRSGYIADFDIDIFEELKIVDFGDAEIPTEIIDRPTVDNILKAQKAVETKVNQVLDVGAIPIVIGQNNPPGNYAVIKSLAERTKGKLGVISLDTHWDIQPIDTFTMDPRVAGGGSWKAKMFEFHENILHKNLVDIGQRGPGQDPALLRDFLAKGVHFYPMWKVKEKGIEWLCQEIKYAYDGTDAVYLHYDMDVVGGAGSASGDIMGTLACPLGMNDYELLRLSFEIGKRGFNALGFVAIPPSSPVMYRTIVYIISYMLAGKILSNK